MQLAQSYGPVVIQLGGTWGFGAEPDLCILRVGRW